MQLNPEQQSPPYNRHTTFALHPAITLLESNDVFSNSSRLININIRWSINIHRSMIL